MAEPPISGKHILPHGKAPTSRKHGVQQQNPSIRDILRELVIEQLRLGTVLITLDQDLPDPHGATAVTQPLLHGLTGTHDGDAADLALEHEAVVGAADGGGDGVLDDGEVVEPLLDEQADDPVGVEDEVGPFRLLAADHSASLASVPRCSHGPL